MKANDDTKCNKELNRRIVLNVIYVKKIKISWVNDRRQWYRDTTEWEEIDLNFLKLTTSNNFLNLLVSTNFSFYLLF